LLSAKSAQLWLDGKLIGYLGELSPQGLKQFELRGATTVAEIQVAALMSAARLVPKYVPLPLQPATSRDVNLVVDERVRWADLAGAVRSSGKFLEELQYVETYRSPQLGAGKKSLLMTLTFRKPEGTLTSEEADQLRDQIVNACTAAYGAQLRA
jgi:phenylalanyl-tRNA synthetase beta chain